jgi:hypothetical protein
LLRIFYGLYDSLESGGLFGFVNITMCENFHIRRKWDRQKIALNIYVNEIIAFLGRHFATSAVIRSKLGDFLF